MPKERDIILLVSRQMRQMYQSYHGQYLYFSMFADLVLETRYTKHLKYHHFGVLYGEDATGQLTLLFGLAIIKKPARLAYLYALEKMFNFLGSYPKVIVTDFDPALAEAVKRLRVRCKVEGALRQHIQLPNNLANNFQNRIEIQFLSMLKNDLDEILTDGDYKSQQQRLKALF